MTTANFSAGLRGFLGDRRIVPVIGCIALVISISFLSLGWMFDDVYHRMQMRNNDDAQAYVPEKYSFGALKGFFVFLDKDPGRTGFLKDKGLVPWWANEKTFVAFWRPLTSLFYLADYTLWPDNPFMMHLHNSLWFVILAIVAMLYYRRIWKFSWLAGLAGIVFIVNGINLMPVAWIANRHTLIAMTLGIVSLIFFDACNGKNRFSSLIFSYLFFGLSLLASELGIVTFAYLVAYTLFLSDLPFNKKIGMLVPFLIILVAWRVVYTGLGFGVYGSEVYVDPINNPIEFVSGLPMKIPFILASAILGIPADLYGYFSVEALPIAAAVAACILIIAGIVLAHKGKPSRVFLFWASSVMFVLFPLCTNVPADRHLVFLSFGAAGMLVQLVHELITQPRAGTKTTHAAKALLLCIIIGVKIIGGIAGTVTLPISTNATRAYLNKFLDFGTEPEIKNQELVIVSPPIIHFVYSLSVDRLFNGLPMPAHIRILSPVFSGFSLTILDPRRISIVTENGFYPPPSPDSIRSQSANALFSSPFPFFNPLYSLVRLERILVDDSYSPRIGDKVRLSDTTITISALTNDNRIKDAVFELDEPLDNDSVRFITWDWKTGEYVPFVLPETGKTVRMNYVGDGGRN